MADNSILGPIGRNGIANAVRPITASVITGWRDVDSAATFEAGQLAKLATVSGKIVVQTVSGTGDSVIGVFMTSNTTTFYRPSFREVHIFGENTAAADDIYLQPYIKTGTLVVEAANGTNYTVTTDYTVNITNGVVTRVGGAGIGATATVYCNYMYKDVNLSGINQVLGSGKACLIEDNGEIGTLIYDTTSATAYALGGSIYYNASGYFTATSGSAAIGKITKAPTADDPELRIKLGLV